MTNEELTSSRIQISTKLTTVRSSPSHMYRPVGRPKRRPQASCGDLKTHRKDRVSDAQTAESGAKKPSPLY